MDHSMQLGWHRQSWKEDDSFPFGLTLKLAAAILQAIILRLVSRRRIADYYPRIVH